MRPLNLAPLQVGDRIQSLHAGRAGAVVKVYADGSACVCWDDGEPQAEGLGHERVPRSLLELVPAVVHTPFQVGALAFPQALKRLHALHLAHVKTRRHIYPAGFVLAMADEFSRPAPGEEERGFWFAFAAWLEFNLEGVHLHPSTPWDVLADLEQEGGRA